MQEKESVYAIIRDRNEQAKVEKGDVLLCDLSSQLNPGDPITFDEVLLVGDEGKVRVGAPLVKGASVKGEVVAHVKGKKVIAFRFKRRKGVRKKRGHRQQYTQVKITEIIG